MNAILILEKGGNVMGAVESPDGRRDEVDRVLDNLRRVVYALLSNSRVSEVPPGRLRAISEGLDSLVRILGAGALTPRIFFAPVSNLQVCDSNDGERMERRFPGTATILGSGRHGRGRRTRGKGKGHDPESIHSESGRPARAA